MRRFSPRLRWRARDADLDPAAVQVGVVQAHHCGGRLLRRRKLDEAVALAEAAARNHGGVHQLAKGAEVVAQVVSAFGLKTTPNVDNLFNSSFLPSRSERQVFAK
jgi:hypothetical protein